MPTWGSTCIAARAWNHHKVSNLHKNEPAYGVIRAKAEAEHDVEHDVEILEPKSLAAGRGNPSTYICTDVGLSTYLGWSTYINTSCGGGLKYPMLKSYTYTTTPIDAQLFQCPIGVAHALRQGHETTIRDPTFTKTNQHREPYMRGHKRNMMLNMMWKSWNPNHWQVGEAI